MWRANAMPSILIIPWAVLALTAGRAMRQRHILGFPRMDQPQRRMRRIGRLHDPGLQKNVLSDRNRRNGCACHFDLQIQRKSAARMAPMNSFS
jgi:hypothetical protein